MAFALTPSRPMSRDRVRMLHNPLLSWRHWTQFRRGRLPGQVVIQYTDRCNASCAQCGMRKENVYSRSTAKLDEIKRLLDSAVAQGVEFISFTGGEPFMYTNDILEGIRYAKRVGIRYIRTGTNGFMFMGHQKAGFTDKINRLADPSELTGPILELFQNPWQIAKRFWAARDYARLWASDIQYYRACDFFNAACPPNGKKLARFAPKLPLSAAFCP